MVRYLGVDLAWGERARTGLAALDEDGRLVASATVVTDDDIASFVERWVPGEVVAAIDAPLVVPNLTGRRDCEAELGAIFGRYAAGAHPSNRSRPYFDPPRGQTLAGRFGWDLDPARTPGAGTSVAIEVYPHPAMVALFGLGRVISYKHKPGRDLPALRRANVELLDHVERVCEDPLRLSTSARWAQVRRVVPEAARKSELAGVEDEVDAVFCAYLAWLWGRRDPRMEVLGDVDRGYIVIPGRPTAAPEPDAGRARRVASGLDGRRAAAAALAVEFRRTVPRLTEAEADDVARAALRWLASSPPGRRQRARPWPTPSPFRRSRVPAIRIASMR
jgi:predicted RNase H-like nuclease